MPDASPTFAPISRPSSIQAYHQRFSDYLLTLLHTTASKTSTPLPANTPTLPSATRKPPVTTSSSKARTRAPVAGPGRPLPVDFTARPGECRGSLTGDEEVPTLISHSSTQSATTVPSPPLVIEQSREAERERAWTVEGRRVWNRMPNGFALTLDAGLKSRRSSAGSGEPAAHDLARDSRAAVGTPGITEKNLAARMGLVLDLPNPAWEDTEATPMARDVPVVPVVDDPSTSLISGDLKDVSATPCSTWSLAPAASSMLNTSVKTIHRARTSSGTQREERLRDPLVNEKDEEYETRRQLRMKKQTELRTRVNAWLDTVDSPDVISPDEIFPTPPTPSLSSSGVRLSPFHISAFDIHPTLPNSSIRRTNEIHLGDASRFRALDALLGDMSLKGSTTTISSGKTGSERKKRRSVEVKPIGETGKNAVMLSFGRG